MSKDADEKEIRKAFRRLALLFHPDRNKSPGAEERFKEINEAYSVLSGKEQPPAERLPPPSKTQNTEPGTFDVRQEYWAAEVLRIWQRMEEERHNNMYR